jgi:hypothetical protein
MIHASAVKRIRKAFSEEAVFRGKSLTYIGWKGNKNQCR